MVPQKENRVKVIMENAVIYARYSSHNQTEQSIEGQIAQGEAYAKSKGYRIIHVYADRAKTGTNDNRDEFQKMLRDSSKRAFQVIIVWKVDRFGRNREEITFNKHKVKKHGVRVEYVAENITDGPEGVILESVLEGMAEYYSLQLSQNVKRGMLESAKKHKVINPHTIALGYKVGDSGEYVIDEMTAPLVEKIFELYVEGYTISEIINYFKNLGINFGKNKISGILKNEKYIGIYRYKNIICDKDAVPRIVTDEMFAIAQEKLKMHKRLPSKSWSYNDYLLTGKIYCGSCNSPMVGESGYSHTGDKYSYYTCLGRKKYKSCTKAPVRSKYLEDLVIKNLMNILNDPDTIDEIANITYEYYIKKEKENDELLYLEEEIKKCDAAMQNLLKALEGGLDYNLIENRLLELKNNKEELEYKEATIKNLGGKILNKNEIKFFLTSIIKGDLSDPNVIKKIVETFVMKVVVFDEKIEIFLNYGQEKTADRGPGSDVSAEAGLIGKHTNLFFKGGDVFISFSL